ncbi:MULTISPECIES: benenodin family lasso peptide [Pseudoxanthomonas]|uniref:Benenodin family lasso peptide n=1 Tax=Pseudoxanthomonas winnipegensis TaxID=2480810 RepID=A0A4Q8L6E8_9GAMM|nr:MULTISPECIES: benenodin family lasso peptide [Pseudoxanthomonas]TAA23307.1 benenodin family lasso peptide [Pseudoxanthomonas winnipegensis]TMN19658.1 benenodin family lasso peptide [Pseudoxanthomonas sp. X-1]UAY74347.1 benenodin family lasso peptide [Pseudoxanthomonas sp. X-1]
MDTNEHVRDTAPADIIELGVASVETRGSVGANEPIGGHPGPGISEE